MAVKLKYLGTNISAHSMSKISNWWIQGLKTNFHIHVGIECTHGFVAFKFQIGVAKSMKSYNEKALSKDLHNIFECN